MMERIWAGTYSKTGMVLKLGRATLSDWYMDNIAQLANRPALTATQSSHWWNLYQR